MKQRGFTLIEVLIVITMAMILGLIVAGAVGKSDQGNTDTVSWGINGVTEIRCIEGYKFVIGDRGQARQVMDEFGKGVKCQKQGISSGL